MNSLYTTKRWSELKKQITEDPDCKCFLCGKKRWKVLKRTGELKRVLKIHLHHINYVNAGDETEDDVVPLCSSCHSIFHQIDRRVDTDRFIHDLKEVIYNYLPSIKER